MQFIVIGRDGTDACALERRLAVRALHLALCDRLKTSGNLLFAVALLNKEEKMCGSISVYNFPSRADLDACLKTEPYVTGKVWETIEIQECRVGPSFQDVFDKLKSTTP